MHQLVIRNAELVDGTGAAARRADVAIDDAGQIAEIATKIGGRGRDEIDAGGHLVTPGWVDVHTHYDGQATWDPELSPSSWHGVTTTVFGNCGVGFAPARADQREWLIQLMEGVEDIPGSALAEGIDWQWETFPEYLDALERMPRVMDIAAQVPHGAVRAYVMGERGARNEPATPDDLRKMAAIVEEGIRAGALGFSSSRTKLHLALDGEAVPGTFAGADEMLALGRAVAAAGGGVMEVASDIGLGGLEGDFGGDISWMRTLAEQHGLTVSYALTQADRVPEQWRELLELSAAPIAGIGGGKVLAMIAGRPGGLLLGWETSLHPFKMHPTYQRMVDLPIEERLRRLRTPDVRAAILSETTGFTGRFNYDIAHGFHKMYPLGSKPDYEPAADQCVAALAQTARQDPYAYCYDVLCSQDGRGLIYFPLTDYSQGSMNPTYERLNHHGTFLSLSDGGAHCRLICDASTPTYMLTHWTRDRTRGPKLRLEDAVKLQTHDTAAVYGLGDRGTIEVGKKGDLNIIDYDALQLDAPRMVYDLPTERAPIAAGRQGVRRNDRVGSSDLARRASHRSTTGHPATRTPIVPLNGEKCQTCTK